MTVLPRKEKLDDDWLCPQSTEKLESIQYIVRFLLVSLKEQWQVIFLLCSLCLHKMPYQSTGSEANSELGCIVHI